MYKCEQWYVYVFRLTSSRRCANACMCVCEGVLWGYSWEDYHVKRLAEAPSLFVASRPTLSPPPPASLSDPSLILSSFLSILSGPKRPRRVTRSVTGITHGSSTRESCERTKMADFSATEEYVHFTFFTRDMKRGLFITFTSQRSNLNRLYNPHFSEFRRKLWMRKKIEFIGRSWEFSLAGNGDMLIKTKNMMKGEKNKNVQRWIVW